MLTKAKGPGAVNAPTQEHDKPWRHSADDVQAMHRARVEVERRDKRIATITAQAALKGTQVYVATGVHGKAEFIACRWGFSRAFNDINALDRFVANLPGAS